MLTKEINLRLEPCEDDSVNIFIDGNEDVSLYQVIQTLEVAHLALTTRIKEVVASNNINEAELSEMLDLPYSKFEEECAKPKPENNIIKLRKS